MFEKFGLTPMQGRIIAWLTISDNPEKTFEELVKFFEASKSSISSSLSFLIQSGIIDYRTISAKRRRYFFITDSFFRIYFKKVLENVAELREYVINTVSQRSPDHPEVSEKILRWISDANLFHESLEKTLSDISHDRI
ncbi:MAG TPA: hypothetical protein PKI12_02160 [Bacteroidales bacterium]|nr:hypothetical protein [Bacteroidales bacterium]